MFGPAREEAEQIAEIGVTLAARMPERCGAERERRVPGEAWKSGVALKERAWRLRGGRVLSWVVAEG